MVSEQREGLEDVFQSLQAPSTSIAMQCIKSGMVLSHGLGLSLHRVYDHTSREEARGVYILYQDLG
jgi:hypothetical protein